MKRNMVMCTVTQITLIFLALNMCVSTALPSVDGWYEAEAPENILYNIWGDGGRTKCGSTCVGEIKEGDVCCSNGYKITQLLGRCDTRASSGGTIACKNGEGATVGASVTFTGVNVAESGEYNVTWWYHCGLYDNWNDHDCGGLPVPSWMTYYNPNAKPQPGCRPHVISVNGNVTQSPTGEHYWQFPCFGGSWDILHTATTTLTLTKGTNTIQLAAPRIGDLDAADIDAMHVQNVGFGNTPLVVAPREFAGDGRKFGK